MSAFEDITNPEAAFAVSWRRAVARAAENKWASVLIAADDVNLLDASASILEHTRTELEHRHWDVVQLGHDPKSRDGALLDGLTLLRASPKNRGAHAVLVHSRAFERILKTIPDPETDPAAFGKWASHYRTLGDFLVDAGGRCPHMLDTRAWHRLHSQPDQGGRHRIHLFTTLHSVTPRQPRHRHSQESQ